MRARSIQPGAPSFECIYSELCHGSILDSCAATPIQPDLVVDVLAASPSGSVDRTDGCVVPVAATLAVSNIGDQAVPNGTTAELSIFRVGESPSIFFESCSTGFIGANQSSACIISGALACGLAEGDYFMSAWVDPSQLIAESNEDNNTRFLPICALPEPSAWAFVLTSGVTLGWLCRGRTLFR